MITQSGLRIAPENDAVPTAGDIAVAMGRITRFAGAVWCPLIAHSILVAELVLQELRRRAGGGAVDGLPTWAWALLHDAHETVTGEICRPWKPDQAKEAQKKLDARISKAFQVDLELVDRALVKAMDERALVLEAEVLGLPGFREIYVRVELGGSADAYPLLEVGEILLTSHLHRSAFGSIYTIQYGAPAVTLFASVLEVLRQGRPPEALVQFDGFMNDIRPQQWRRA